jgi:GTP-binding protein Era
LNYQKEIPYCSEVEIESFEEEGNLIRMRALIHVARDSQKGIIIGHKGTNSRKQAGKLELTWKTSSKEGLLELYVKVQRTGGKSRIT